MKYTKQKQAQKYIKMKESKTSSNTVEKKDNLQFGNLKTLKEKLETNSELLEYETIENTIFTIITNPETQTHIMAIGNNLVSEETNSKEELIDKIKKKDWMLLYNTMYFIAKQAK